MYCVSCWTNNTKLVESTEQGCVLCGCQNTLSSDVLLSYIDTRMHELNDELYRAREDVMYMEKEFALLEKAKHRLSVE